VAVSGDSRGLLKRVLLQPSPQFTAYQSFSDETVSVASDQAEDYCRTLQAPSNRAEL
jgi:hypothetical protein